ncbi:hypothetical protein [Pseudomonas sp. 65/3-MNA-CIBAN-0223]|uniref:hypothetical protein n=1 Tax=Pseudomonas sp. 65/3-MNA-CIBAN-0223 TaxID=3140476 RepID=UPI003327E41F
MPKSWVQALNLDPHSIWVTVEDCNTRTAFADFGPKTVAIRLHGLVFHKYVKINQTEAIKALEFDIRFVFGFFCKTLHVGFFFCRATR